MSIETRSVNVMCAKDALPFTLRSPPRFNCPKEAVDFIEPLINGELKPVFTLKLLSLSVKNSDVTVDETFTFVLFKLFIYPLDQNFVELPKSTLLLLFGIICEFISAPKETLSVSEFPNVRFPYITASPLTER